MLHKYRNLSFIALIVSLIALSGLAVSGTAQAESGTAQAAIKAPVRAGAPAAPTQAAPDVEYSCSGTPNTSSRRCYFQTQNGYAPLFAPNGSLHALLPLNDKVLVTCYYYGNPPAPYLGDGVQDHVTWENTIGNFTGHIPDEYIDEGGDYPYDYPFDIAECG
jgi:hypothetical protein